MKTYWLAAILVVPMAGGGTVAAADARLQLDHYLHDSQTLSARFTQSLFDEQDVLLEQSAGTVSIKRPGGFRWDYLEPYRQSIIAGGGKVWFFDVDLAQVTVGTFDPATDSSPAALLGNAAQIDDRYLVTERGSDGGLEWLELTPRDAENQYASIRLGFNGPDLKAMRLADNFGQLTVIEFSAEQRGIDLDDALFTFVAPDGVDVLDAQPLAPADP